MAYLISVFSVYTKLETVSKSISFYSAYWFLCKYITIKDAIIAITVSSNELYTKYFTID